MMADASGGSLATELKSVDRSGRVLRSQAQITDGDWPRVELTWDGLSRVLSVDDIEAARDTQPALPSSMGRMYIGAGRNRAAGSFWSGLIDDVKVYDRAVNS
jgi:YD repeat-containing protein